ncbi:hypothetical protein HZS_4945, partial [Henneguya salminicola]
MSNDLSFDGDSDEIYENEKEQMDKDFIFDASSHVNFTPEEIVEESDGYCEPIVAEQADLSTVKSLHYEITGLLSPKQTETIEMKDVESAQPEAIQESSEEKDSDSRSIYVGNVDYSTTVGELSAHFSSSGTINRITIGSHKVTGQPKGYLSYIIVRFAYIEFADREGVLSSLALNDTLFKGRMLKICPKRTNIPGLSTTTRGSFRGRGRGSARIGRFTARRGRGRFVHKYSNYANFRASIHST